MSVMWSKCYQLIISIFCLSIVVKCDDVGNSSNFNANLREYSGNNAHISNVKTLQTEELARHAHFSPTKNTIKFKETQDNAIASSDHIKGYALYSKSEYPLHEYEEHPPYGYGPDFYAHDLSHHGGGYHGHRYHGLDFHHKHFGYGLEKAILWPIAGLALLGAAAALVTNPILLQLGVVGKRRRRDTEEDTSLDLEAPVYNNEDAPMPMVVLGKNERKLLKKEIKKHLITKRSGISTFLKSNFNDSQFKKKYDYDNFVPIPLRLRH